MADRIFDAFFAGMAEIVAPASTDRVEAGQGRRESGDRHHTFISTTCPRFRGWQPRSFLAMFAIRRITGTCYRPSYPTRSASTAVSGNKFKVVVVGGGAFCTRISWSPEVSHTLKCSGAGGLSVANQIYNRFKDSGKALNHGDIVILDAADYHHYQVCTPSSPCPVVMLN